MTRVAQVRGGPQVAPLFSLFVSPRCHNREPVLVGDECDFFDCTGMPEKRIILHMGGKRPKNGFLLA